MQITSEINKLYNILQAYQMLVELLVLEPQPGKDVIMEN